MKRTTRAILHCSLAVLPLLAACGSGSPPGILREPDEYLGCATDENWRTFDEQERSGTNHDEATAPRVLAPAPGATLPAGDKPTFTWQPSVDDEGKPGGDAACAACPGICGQHLPPVTGTVYDLQFVVGGETVWRTLTTMQRYTPSDGAWSRLRGRSVSLRLVRMALDDNQATAGPFEAELAFSVTAP